jgi:DNA-binding transcriptional LysR family regulator
MSLDIRSLRYFVAVAEELNISKAAERLHISQPPLSLQIQRLEEELGFQLMQRHKRGVTLTHAGQALAQEAKAVMSRMVQAVDTVQQIGRGELGRLQIGIIGSAMWGDFPGLIQRFTQSYPEVVWGLQELNPSAQISALEDKRIDIGFWRSVDTKAPHFDTVLVSKEEVQVAVCHDHPLCQKPRLLLSDLASENFLSMHTAYSDFAAHLNRCCLKQGFEPHIFQHAYEPQTLLAMVSAGMGITLLPESLAKIKWPKVKFLRIHKDAPSADLHLFYRKDEQSPVVNKFVQMIKRR